jgi:DNA-binding GntR family transcriptional regulator
MLNQLYDKLILKSRVEQLPTKRAQSVIAEHEEILNMLKAGDAKSVYQKMKKHIQKQKKYVLEHIQLREKGEVEPFLPLNKFQARKV